MSAAAADVFLSYSRIDAPSGAPDSGLPEASRLATFLDRDQLPAGQLWLSALEQAIAAARRSPCLRKNVAIAKNAAIAKKIRLIV